MNMMRFVELVITKVHLNLKAEAARNYLSYLWWVLEPALFVAVFYLVFGVFMARGGEGFVAFLVCGKIPFLWMSRSVNNSAMAITNGRGLMNQISIPKVFFPTVVVVQDAVKSAVVFALMMLFVWFSGYAVTMSWLAIPVLMLVQLVFIAPLAILGSMLVPFVPDLRFIIATCMMMMMFASGIFYDYKEVILPEHQPLFLANPMALLIDQYRTVLLDGLWPDWIRLGAVALVCAAVLALVLVALWRLDHKYPRLVLQ